MNYMMPRYTIPRTALCEGGALMCDSRWHEAENQARHAGTWDTLSMMEKIALFEAVQRDSRLTPGEYLAKLTCLRDEAAILLPCGGGAGRRKSGCT